MECHHSFTTDLDSWSQPNYPWHHHRRSLFSILLHNINLYTTSAIWWNIIQLLCDYTKCSLWMEISTGRWRLQEWFRKLQHTNSPKKTLKINHISSIKNASFNPNLVTSCGTVQSHLRLVCRWLTYNSSNDSDTSEDILTAPRVTPDAQVYLEEDKKTSKQYLWMTNTGLLRKCLIELYAYTNMPYCMDYACIHALVLLTSFLCQHHGFEWHFWFWRYHDNIQWWW